MVLNHGNHVIIFFFFVFLFITLSFFFYYFSFFFIYLFYLLIHSYFFKINIINLIILLILLQLSIEFHLWKLFLGPEELLATKIFWGLIPLLIGFAYPLLPWMFAYLLLIGWLLEGIPNEWFWGVKFWLNCCLWLWNNAFFELFRVAFTWRMFLLGMYTGVKGITTFWPV